MAHLDSRFAHVLAEPAGKCPAEHMKAMRRRPSERPASVRRSAKQRTPPRRPPVRSSASSGTPGSASARSLVNLSPKPGFPAVGMLRTLRTSCLSELRACTASATLSNAWTVSARPSARGEPRDRWRRGSAARGTPDRRAGAYRRAAGLRRRPGVSRVLSPGFRLAGSPSRWPHLLAACACS